MGVCFDGALLGDGAFGFLVFGLVLGCLWVCWVGVGLVGVLDFAWFTVLGMLAG